FLEADEKQFPTGELLQVNNSSKDFTTLKPLGKEPLDDVFALNKTLSEEIVLKGSKSGLSLRIETDQPAVVMYAPKALPTEWNYQTKISARHPSVCLETQNFPDAPNHDNFPSSLLRVGEVYSNRMAWKFDFAE